jgi:hypothetical protein
MNATSERERHRLLTYLHDAGRAEMLRLRLLVKLSAQLTLRQSFCLLAFYVAALLSRCRSCLSRLRHPSAGETPHSDV